MKNYDTVSEALNDLYSKGYTTDFSLLTEQDSIYSHNQNHSLNADEFEIDEVHRFEGDTDPGDEMILFAISSKKHGIKGVLLNAFGIYSDSNNSQIVEKLKYHENINVPPIKRAPELISLSREHHHSLLLCWKIKTGLAKNIEVKRIKKYVDWFYKNHLLPHFDMEEKYVFTLLSENNEKRKLVLEQHNGIKTIIEKETVDVDDLMQLQNLLAEHIRFEERILFNEIQKIGNLESVVEFAKGRDEKFYDNEDDPFWK